MNASAAAPTLPWGLYVHVPWCRRRCPYCDFSFEVGRARSGFAERVLAEVDTRRAEMPPGPSSTLSLGGGTPTALPHAEMARLIGGLHARGLLAENAEIALEGNPEDLLEGGVQALAAAGFNRLSLGVQSFDDTVLKSLGRNHTGAQARSVIRDASRAGLRLSIDLIVGTPHEEAHRLENDLAVVEAEGIGHVSAYLLTIEPDTPWEKMIAKGQRSDVDHDAQADALESVHASLTAKGLRQYEISSYAVPGEESVHNRLYWGKGHYLGVGPSAHSLTVTTDGRALRRENAASVDAYFRALPSAISFGVEEVDRGDAFREAVAFGLRDLVAGISLDALVARHHVGEEIVAAAQHTLAKAVANGHARTDDSSGTQRHYLTPLGARFADAIARGLLAEPEGVSLTR